MGTGEGKRAFLDLYSKHLSVELLEHERDVVSQPFEIKGWLQYLSFVGSKDSQDVPLGLRVAVFERALCSLPASYKIWNLYTTFVVAEATKRAPDDPARRHADDVLLRAARALPHCPVPWERAVERAVQERRWTSVRSLVDEAVQKLPVTLHCRFWRHVIGIVVDNPKISFPRLSAHIAERACMVGALGENGVARLFRLLKNAGRVNDAVIVLSAALEDESWGGDERRDLWMQLVEVAVRSPKACTGVDVVALVRKAIASARAEVGELWASLAEIYVRVGQFQLARAVYEEALAKVTVVRDFAIVFDAYSQFLESMVTAAVEDDEDDDEDDEEEEDDYGDDDEKMDDCSTGAKEAADDNSKVATGSADVNPNEGGAMNVDARGSGNSENPLGTTSRPGKGSSDFHALGTDSHISTREPEGRTMPLPPPSKLVGTQNGKGDARGSDGREIPLSDSEAQGRNRGQDAQSSRAIAPLDFLDPEALLAELESLTNRRPLLLSDVWLRQNPHNVHEWHKRAKLFVARKDSAGAVAVFTEAVGTVDPWRASHGRPHTLWTAFARLYERAKDWETARRVFDRAVADPELFKTPEDLATVWCEYVEMELRRGSIEDARAVARRACDKPAGFDKRRAARAPRRRPRPNTNEAALGAGAGHVAIHHEYDMSSPAWMAWKSARLWGLRLDLEESIGSVSDVFSVHERMLELGIASVQTILNGADYLRSKRLFEQSFRLLDRGAHAFGWPNSLPLWVAYLESFVKRYGGRKLERARDLFEETLRAVEPIVRGGTSKPSPHLRLVFLMFADLEERFGNARRLLAVYERAIREVRAEQRCALYKLYIARAAELFGVTRTRPIYEDALEHLTKRDELVAFSVRFAAMETRLNEFERSRAVYEHGAQIADPRAGPASTAFWKAWHAFELAHGTEDTFRDMLRAKRHVQMRNAGVHLVTSVAAGAGTVEAAAAAAAVPGAGGSAIGSDAAELDPGGMAESAATDANAAAMAALEKEVTKVRAEEARLPAKPGSLVGGKSNNEEIDLDVDSDESDSDSDSDASVQKKGDAPLEDDPSQVAHSVLSGAGTASETASETAIRGRPNEDHETGREAQNGGRGVGDGAGGGSDGVSDETARMAADVELEQRPVPQAVAKLAGIATTGDAPARASNGLTAHDKPGKDK